MKILLPFLLILCGCQATVTNKRVSTVPPEKRTVTVTETTKIERPVPVYRTETVVESKTKTSDGSAPLHKAEILDAK